MSDKSNQTNQIGSEWRKWDLQVQTILDDSYVSIDSYFEALKQQFPEKCQALINKIGSEELIKKYDSKEYFFTDTSESDKIRIKNYVKLFLNFQDIFNENVGGICITDHNYDHNILIDCFLKESETTNTKVIPGVEINVQGVHYLVIFGILGYGKSTYSETIKTFLTKIDVTCKKVNDSLTVCSKGYRDVIDEIVRVGAIVLYPHCNSINGLFQERGKTDRTHLADQFNYQKSNILQSKNLNSVRATFKFISGKQTLKSKYVFTLGSDARSLKNIFEPDEDGNFCWIKADPTFEGLKQIVYEPETRVFIGEEKPKKPINTIDSITLKIPNNVLVGEDTFCFSDTDDTYKLSPYFNCFIGGRGSGKSTILNFLGLHSNNADSSKTFWFGDGKDKKGLNPIGFYPGDNSLFSFSGTEIFEFLAQSEIETFARDKVKFTQAIYDRANGPSKILQNYEDDIIKYQADLDRVTDAVFGLQELQVQKKDKEKEKRSLENTKNIIESDNYKKLTDAISDLTQKTQVHKKWANEADLFKTQLSDTIDFYSKVLDGNDDQIKYKESYLLAISKVKEAIQILDENNFSDIKKDEKVYQDNLVILEEKLKQLLNKGKFSDDNIEQIKSAPQKIVVLEREIEQINFEISGKNKVINTLEDVQTKLRTDKEDYESKIKEIVDPLQQLLEKQFESNRGKDIKKISLEYSFDEDRAWNTLVKEFYERFKELFKDTEKGKDVCDYISDNRQVFTSNDYVNIQKTVQQSEKNGRQYIKFLDEVFKDENNFKVFNAIRDKHLYDVKTNKIIQVKYNEKNVEQASFGQRCTAVVVILLLFGNYPLIIDEPEAHLDSSLIANYLVPLLKEKKSDRQIIFATHNANFVINGDAEKIFILKNDTGKTNVVETTIEDITNREELLKLEGGKEAFEKRGEKLNIYR
ncbi:MAG: AAA family ATPase [Candidatus Daviesbacteria bacterium]|nr:AAA family ATPase [Candidatus Daviesbacteria bacterium]